MYYLRYVFFIIKLNNSLNGSEEEMEGISKDIGLIFYFDVDGKVVKYYVYVGL